MDTEAFQIRFHRSKRNAMFCVVSVAHTYLLFGSAATARRLPGLGVVVPAGVGPGALGFVGDAAGVAVTGVTVGLVFPGPQLSPSR